MSRLEARLRRLDRRLGIDNAGQSEWVWAVPGGVFLGTLAMFLAFIQIGGGSVALTLSAGLPLGLICAAVMAAISIGFMHPVEDGEPESSPVPDPPGQAAPPGEAAPPGGRTATTASTAAGFSSEDRSPGSTPR
jgi:hypothetical protein